jgi:hypothetical protein
MEVTGVALLRLRLGTDLAALKLRCSRRHHPAHEAGVVGEGAHREFVPLQAWD